MKKVLKVLLIVISSLIILSFGGCALTLFVGGKAVNEVAKDYDKQDKAEKQAIENMLKNAPKPIEKKDDYNWTVTYTFTNKSKINFDYIELDLNIYDKDNVKLDTNMTNITDVKAGQTFKLTIDIYQENADHYDIETLTNSALE